MPDSLLIDGRFELLGGGVASTLPQCAGATFRLAPGFDLSAPQPTTTTVISLLLDGERSVGYRASNRITKIPVIVFADDRATLAAAVEELLQAIDQQQWSMTWTRSGGLPVVFDCFKAKAASVNYNLKHQQAAGPIQALQISFPAMPYLHSDTPLTLTFDSPFAGTVAPPSSIELDNYATVSGSGWVRSTQHVLDTYSGYWSNSGGGYPVYSGAVSSTDISDLSAVTFWFGLGTGYEEYWGWNGGNVTFSVTLTDSTGGTVTFGVTQWCDASNNAGVPNFQRIIVPLPDDSTFDWGAVTAYEFACWSASSYYYGQIMQASVYLNAFTVAPASASTPASTRGWLATLYAVGTAHAPLAVQFQLLESGLTTQTFSTPGGFSASIPAGVADGLIALMGGAGPGASLTAAREGGGGAGAGSAEETTYPLPGGSSVSGYVGAGGTAGAVTADGEDTWLDASAVLNSNDGFETTVSPWTGVNGATLAQSAAYAYSGTHSMSLTPDGSTANPQAASEEVTGLTAGTSYSAAARVMIPSGTGWATVAIGINWYTSGGTPLLPTSISSAFTVPANKWTRLLEVATAPATAAKGQPFVQLTGTPAGTVVAYVDQARLRSGPGVRATGGVAALPGSSAGATAVDDSTNSSHHKGGDGASGTSSGGGTPVIVQTKQGKISGSSGTITLASPTGAGNYLVVLVCAAGSSANPSVGSVTLGGVTDHFAQGADSITAAAPAACYAWTDQDCAGAQTAIAVTLTGGSGTLGATVTILEISNVATSGAVDLSQAGDATGSSSSFTSGATGTTSQAEEVLIGVAASGYLSFGGGPSLSGPAGPWTNLTQQTLTVGSEAQTTIAGYQVVSSTGTATYAGTITGTNFGYNALVLTLKAAAATQAGGGGSSAGTASDGNNGSGSTGGIAPTGGAAGGAGATVAGPGAVGGAPGAAGGGALSAGSPEAGGTGGAGLAKITYSGTALASFKTLVAHIPGPDAPASLIPFVSVGNGADTPNGGTEYAVQAVASGVNARFNGTYSILAVAETINSPSTSRTVTLTIKEYEYSGGPATSTTVARAFVPDTTGAVDLTSGLNGFVALGEVTLPQRDIAPDNTASYFTVTVTDTDTSDRWLDVLFIDTSGQLVLINLGSGYTSYFVDVPDQTSDFGRILGSQGDRNQAASVLANAIVSGGPLLVNPGSNTMLMYSVDGAPSAVGTYRPAYRIDRPS
jgi:hypothetical protein